MRPYSGSKTRRGMTLPEMMISVSIFSLVGIFLTFIVVEIGKNTREAISEIPAQENTYRAMDFIRSKLLPAEFGSININDTGNAITFRNPRNTYNSTLLFDQDTRQCIFDENVNTTGDELPWGRNIRGRFAATDTPRRIKIEISSLAVDRENENRTITVGEELTIRN